MRVLLHCCCGPCASHCLEALRNAGHDVTLFFSNANIAPHEEFEKRLHALQQLAEAKGATYLVDPPDHNEWLDVVAKGFEDAREGGARCARCFRYSLTRAVKQFQLGGYDGFTTSLTVSPHKCSPVIFSIGKDLDPEHFLQIDFKKKNGFLNSIRLSKELGLYRQNYCGCEFSLRQRLEYEKQKAQQHAIDLPSIQSPVHA